MRAPEFWGEPGAGSHSVRSTALLPLATLYDTIGRLRRSRTTPYRAPVPVICIGNLVAGGAGKTPLVLELLAELRRRGKSPHALTRGYGGRLSGPVMVDPASHSYRDVGDEALLLAAVAPVWVARDRAAGAKAAAAAGADILVMDDGFQNPTLHKDLAILAIDAGFGFGNGRLIPAGPLREAPAQGLARAQAVVLIGRETADFRATLRLSLPIMSAKLVPVDQAKMWRRRRILAFAGIGRPLKFFQTLVELGAELVATAAFPDHHPYRPDELDVLLARAASANSVLVTTAKDAVRLPADYRAAIETVPVSLAWNNPADCAVLGRLLDTLTVGT